MKPGLVLSDEQCQRKFGPRKGVKDDQFSKPLSRVRSNTSEEMEESVDDPDTRVEQGEMNDEDYSVLIDPNKSLSDQNRTGRQLFISLFTTGSVSSGKLSEEELDTFKEIDDNLAMITSTLIGRQVQNSRKFLSFNTQNRELFLKSGYVNIPDTIQTLVDQTVLVLKQNQDFKIISKTDQTELLDYNAIVASIVSSLELYNPQSHSITWSLTESDYRLARKLGFRTINGRASFGLSDVLKRMDSELRDDMVKLFKFFDYFSQIGVPKSSMHLLAFAVMFSHDCCDIENKEKVEGLKIRYLIILFETITQSEGILGACNIALKLHTAIHHLNRICQLLTQKFIYVHE